MPFFIKVLTALGLLYNVAETVEVRTFQEYVEDFTPDYFGAYHSIDQSPLYVGCNYAEPKTIDCWLNLATTNHREQVQRCKVKYIIPENHRLYRNYRGTDLFQSTLAGSKVLLAWSTRSEGEGHLRYGSVSLVDMDNCSDVFLHFQLDDSIYDELQHTTNEPNYHILVSHDGFNIYMSSEAVCGQVHNPCILRYNHNGQQVGGLVPLPSKYYENELSMVADRLNSSGGGYFTTIKYNADMNVLMNISHVDHEGAETTLVVHHLVKSLGMIRSAVRSNEHGFFSFCHQDNKWNDVALNCMQCDAKGRKKMVATVRLERGLRVIEVFNRREGGVVLVYLDCRRSLSTCADAQVKLDVMNANGHVIGDAVLTGVGLRYSLVRAKRFSIDLSETDAEYCFYFAYAQQLWTTTFSYVNMCMSKRAVNYESRYEPVISGLCESHKSACSSGSLVHFCCSLLVMRLKPSTSAVRARLDS